LIDVHGDALVPPVSPARPGDRRAPSFSVATVQLDLGAEFDADAGVGVCILQVMNQLRMSSIE
jgi:hypothetical protein